MTKLQRKPGEKPRAAGRKAKTAKDEKENRREDTKENCGWCKKGQKKVSDG